MTLASGLFETDPVAPTDDSKLQTMQKVSSPLIGAAHLPTEPAMSMTVSPRGLPMTAHGTPSQKSTMTPSNTILYS